MDSIEEHTVEEVRDLLHEASATPSSYALLERAWSFAKSAHKGQQRRSGEPHTEHLFQTARNLANLGMDATVIAAGILHDTLEDTQVTYEQLEQEFGAEIAFLVDGVTKLKKQHLAQDERQIQSLRKMLVAASRDPRIVVIKLCDRLHNMQTLQFMPPRKRERIARETLDIYVPAAERLSLGALRRELEDIAFSYSHPLEYESTKRLFEKEIPARRAAADQIEEELTLSGNVNILETKIRTKGLNAFFRKLERKEGDMSRIHDLVAVQVIVPSIDACYEILGLIHSIGQPCPGTLKDFIAFPRPNGYRSLRTTIKKDGGIPVEIQIFTADLYHRSLYGDMDRLSNPFKRSDANVSLRQVIARFFR